MDNSDSIKFRHHQVRLVMRKFYPRISIPAIEKMNEMLVEFVKEKTESAKIAMEYAGRRTIWPQDLELGLVLDE